MVKAPWANKPTVSVNLQMLTNLQVHITPVVMKLRMEALLSEILALFKLWRRTWKRKQRLSMAQLSEGGVSPARFA